MRNNGHVSVAVWYSRYDMYLAISDGPKFKIYICKAMQIAHTPIKKSEWFRCRQSFAYSNRISKTDNGETKVNKHIFKTKTIISNGWDMMWWRVSSIYFYRKISH